MKRFSNSIGLMLFLGLCITGAGIPQNEPVKEVEIIETTKIIPTYDVVGMVKEKVRYTKDWNIDNSDTTIQLNYIDSQILMRIASAEASTEGAQGMLYVMNVVLNRVKSPDYPNSVWEVVTQPYQFQPITNGTYYTVDIPPEAHEALAMLESNKNNNSEIVAFESINNNASLTRYYDTSFTYLGHTFYTLKKH